MTEGIAFISDRDVYPDLDVIGCYIVDDNLMPNENDVRLHNEVVKHVSQTF